MAGNNLFAYCNNNPINIVDSKGTRPIVDSSGFESHKDAALSHQAMRATSLVSTITFIAAGTLSKNYTYRVDNAHVPNDKKHIHIFNKGKEVANQKDDGNPQHPNKNKPGEPPKSIKDELKEKGIWDWDGNIKKAEASKEPSNSGIMIDIYDPFYSPFIIFYLSVPTPVPSFAFAVG